MAIRQMRLPLFCLGLSLVVFLCFSSLSLASSSKNAEDDWEFGGDGKSPDLSLSEEPVPSQEPHDDFVEVTEERDRSESVVGIDQFFQAKPGIGSYLSSVYGTIFGTVGTIYDKISSLRSVNSEMPGKEFFEKLYASLPSNLDITDLFGLWDTAVKAHVGENEHLDWEVPAELIEQHREMNFEVDKEHKTIPSMGFVTDLLGSEGNDRLFNKIAQSASMVVNIVDNYGEHLEKIGNSGLVYRDKSIEGHVVYVFQPFLTPDRISSFRIRLLYHGATSIIWKDVSKDLTALNPPKESKIIFAGAVNAGLFAYYHAVRAIRKHPLIAPSGGFLNLDNRVKVFTFDSPPPYSVLALRYFGLAKENFVDFRLQSFVDNDYFGTLGVVEVVKFSSNVQLTDIDPTKLVSSYLDQKLSTYDVTGKNNINISYTPDGLKSLLTRVFTRAVACTQAAIQMYAKVCNDALYSLLVPGEQELRREIRDVLVNKWDRAQSHVLANSLPENFSFNLNAKNNLSCDFIKKVSETQGVLECKIGNSVIGVYSIALINRLESESLRRGSSDSKEDYMRPPPLEETRKEEPLYPSIESLPSQQQQMKVEEANAQESSSKKGKKKKGAASNQPQTQSPPLNPLPSSNPTTSRAPIEEINSSMKKLDLDSGNLPSSQPFESEPKKEPIGSFSKRPQVQRTFSGSESTSRRSFRTDYEPLRKCVRDLFEQRPKMKILSQDHFTSPLHLSASTFEHGRLDYEIQLIQNSDEDPIASLYYEDRPLFYGLLTAPNMELPISCQTGILPVFLPNCLQDHYSSFMGSMPHLQITGTISSNLARGQYEAFLEWLKRNVLKRMLTTSSNFYDCTNFQVLSFSKSFCPKLCQMWSNNHCQRVYIDNKEKIKFSIRNASNKSHAVDVSLSHMNILQGMRQIDDNGNEIVMVTAQNIATNEIYYITVFLEPPHSLPEILKKFASS